MKINFGCQLIQFKIEPLMERIAKIFYFFGIIFLIAGITSLVVWLVVILKPSDSDSTEPGEFVRPAYGYRCEASKCNRVEITQNNLPSLSSFNVCRMTCGDEVGTLWPIPTGVVIASKNVVKLNPQAFSISTENFKPDPRYWNMAQDRFHEMQRKKLPKRYSLEGGGKKLLIQVEVDSDNQDTKEGYTLAISDREGDSVYASIQANNFYGARNGLETLSQLIMYDDITNEIFIVSSASIADEPKFKYRGILLDTSRNYYSVESIKRTIEGMAMVKLNSFHWHITDTHSFPFEMKSRPELTRLGAYSPDKIYTADDIEDIVHYGKARGVRIVPEFDAPSHVGEGWQETDLTTCFDFHPWRSYCLEPPCGQLDPTKDEVYNVLEDIYREMVESFQQPDLFHMGGDEVQFRCWNASDSLKQWMFARGWDTVDEDFVKLWGYFQTAALERLDKVYPDKVPVVLWTSTLTEEPYIAEYLDKDRYIIQIWTSSDDPMVKTVLENGFKAIVSNADALYLDCGFGSWVADGNNWCTPYKGWQKIYDNRMEDMAGEYIDQILGAEAPLWSEEVDEWSLDTRIWPRAAALAERLWSNPEAGYRGGEARMLLNRQRLVSLAGVSADRLQPEWCLQNEGGCVY